MSKWIYTDEDGDEQMVELTDDEVAVFMAAQEADDDDDDGDDDDDDPAPSRVEDTTAEFERVEAAFRKERTAIRASRDAEDLAFRRESFEAVLRDDHQSNIVHTRSRDLLGEIEQRELKLRAERLADRGR